MLASTATGLFRALVHMGALLPAGVRARVVGVASVAEHLKIGLPEYDRRIRTFIPQYEELLSAVAVVVALVGARRPLIVDLGIGTGALAARCLRLAPRASVYGIDEDPEMLAVAARRLGRKHGGHRFVAGDFARGVRLGRRVWVRGTGAAAGGDGRLAGAPPPVVLGA